MSEREEWPEYVMLRDTKLHDDMGGAGQRIYTTAGQGYEKIKYVRADLLEAARAPLLEELERERMRLVACGVVAMSDTPESAASARDMHADYRSEACESVARRVDECIRRRAQVELLEENARLERAGYIVSMRLMQSDLVLDDAERAALDAFLNREAMRRVLEPRK
jgi:hypothetical protein